MSEAHHKARLDKAVLHGFAWTAGAKWLTQVVTWLAVFVSARLLSPADFGLVEMAGIVTNVTSVLAEFGIGIAVMQMPELNRRVIAQLNSVSVFACTLTFAVVAAISPLAAAFFRSRELQLVLIVNCLTLLITGLQAIPSGLLQRSMDYRRLSLAEGALAVVQAVVTVAFALFGAAYWSLVAGVVAGKVVSALLIIYWSPVSFALPRWRELVTPLRLAWHVTVGRIAWAFYMQADGIVVGRTMGNSPLGAYRLAISLAGAPAEKISLLLMRVAGPLFANIQDDLSLMRRYFLIASELMFLGTLPVTFGLVAVAPEAVTVLLGSKWKEAAAPLAWLAAYAGLRTFNVLVQQVLTSLRLTGFTMWMSLLNLVAMPVAFYIASYWGMAAVAASWLILSPLTTGPLVIKLLAALRLPYREYGAVLLPSIVGSSGMVLAVLAVKAWLSSRGLAPAFSLAVQVAVGAAGYAAIMFGLYRERLLRYFHFLRKLRGEKPAPSSAGLQ